MANQPAIQATCKVTADDINANNTLKNFTNVSQIHYDFAKGMVNVVDATGSFFFSLGDMSTITFTVSAGDFSPIAVVMS